MTPQRTDDLFDPAMVARLDRLRLIAKRLASRAATGRRRSRRLGDGLEFADHRVYAPGDDVRFIDWAYYARMERLLLRMFHEHSEGDVWILLDASASMAPGGRGGRFDYARRVAAALAYVAAGSLDRVGCAPFADRLGATRRIGRNRGEIFGMLDFLRDLAPGGRTDLAGAVEQFVGDRAPGGTVVLVSDLLDCGGALSEALARVQFARCESVVIHVYDPEPPEAMRTVELRDSETGERMNVRLSEPLRESYRRRLAEFGRQCERSAGSRGAIYVAAPTDVPFDELVLATLRRAGVIAE